MRMTAFSTLMNPYFIGRNVAVLQHTQFAYVEESTRRRMHNIAPPKPRGFKKNGQR